MKILWLSMTKGLHHNLPGSNPCYNGGGWISSLQELIMSSRENTLALAYITHTPIKKEIQDNVVYYPIYEASQTYWQKMIKYYGGYKKIDSKKHLNQIKQIIQDFQPDIIHLFGMENPMANILGNTTVPVIVHLQGLLGPCDNAFFPVGFNKSSFLFPISIREWLLRNGYMFAKNSIHTRGKRESSLFKKVDYAMGRTEWDYQVSQLLAPQSIYFHVDEVLREPFYRNAGKWKWKDKKLTLISTISNTMYKGLDLILKTASILKRETQIPFEWIIIGIHKKDEIVKFFESKLKIKSDEINVTYKGVYDAESLCNELLQSHIYIHPSYIDNSPNSLCEAQLLGLPVIGTYVGGIPSLIKDKETGIIIPANAPYELSYHIKKCYMNRDYSIQLGHNGFKSANERHDKNIITLNLLKVYESIINENRKNDTDYSRTSHRTQS